MSVVVTEYGSLPNKELGCYTMLLFEQGSVSAYQRLSNLDIDPFCPPSGSGKTRRLP